MHQTIPIRFIQYFRVSFIRIRKELLNKLPISTTNIIPFISIRRNRIDCAKKGNRNNMPPMSKIPVRDLSIRNNIIYF